MTEELQAKAIATIPKGIPVTRELLIAIRVMYDAKQEPLDDDEVLALLPCPSLETH